MAALYALLVGAPVLGLVTILQVGEGLLAPHAVGGAWVVERGVEPDVSPCPSLAGFVAGATVSVSQSGPRSVLTLDDPDRTTFPATLDGTSFTVAPRDRTPGSCSGFALRLEVVTDGGIDAVRLEGILEPGVACSGCGPVPIRLSRATEDGS